MKKVLSAIALTTILVGAAVPFLASADVPTNSQLQNSCTISRDTGITGCPTSGTCDYTTNQLCGQCCLLNTIYVITDWIFFILLVIAGIMILIAALIFVTSSGSPERTATARNMILYAAVGIIVALLAKAIPAFVRSIVT